MLELCAGRGFHSQLCTLVMREVMLARRGFTVAVQALTVNWVGEPSLRADIMTWTKEDTVYIMSMFPNCQVGWLARCIDH